MDVKQNEKLFPYHYEVLAIIGLSIFILVSRTLLIGESLWLDELWYTKYKLGNAGLLLNTVVGDSHPPLPAILMFFWIKIFGDSEFSIRLPSLLCGLATFPVLYGLVKQLAGKHAAALTLILLALSPVHIWYSREARPYSMILLLLLACCKFFMKFTASPRQIRFLVAYFFCLFALIFSHYYLSFLLLLLSLAACFEKPRARNFLLCANLINGALILSFFYWKYKVGMLILYGSYLRPFSFFEWWMLFFQWFGTGNSILSINPYHQKNQGWKIFLVFPQIFLVHCTLLTVLALGVHDIVKRRPSGTLLILSVFIGFPAVILIVNHCSLNQIYIERSLFALLPFYYAVIATGAVKIRSNKLRYITVISITAISLLSFLTFMYKQDTWTVYKPKPDWRTAAAFLNNKNKEKNPLIFEASPSDELTFYSSKLKTINIQGNEIEFSNRVAGHSGFFIIHNLFWEEYFKKLIACALKLEGFRLEETFKGKGIEVYEFVSTKIEVPGTSS